MLENAAKYSPAGSQITISAEQGIDEIIVHVADEGIGLKPDEEKLIFEKFYRGKVESAERGLGLGLAICKSIISLHGGKITAKNRPIKGTTFSFTLPVESV